MICKLNNKNNNIIKMSSFLDIKDDERYSRQSYTIGKDVMGKISNSKILVIGYNCLGLEIIKNLHCYY